MNKREFEIASEDIRKRFNILKEEERELRRKYFTEVLERNGYRIGQHISYQGKEFEIYGFDLGFAASIYVLGRPLKKDGTPSKNVQALYNLHLNKE